MLEIATIFQPLVTVFGGVLKFFHNSIGIPWGWSIVVLTVVVRALLLPLAVKQFHSMQKMQRLTPEMKRLQAKYKGDKQRQQQELMKLYQEHGVNPFGSCLPLVAQLPVFIGLYYTLRTSLRADICPQLQHHIIVNGKSVIDTAHSVACGAHQGASFLFISDITTKATGATLIALIVLYVGTQLASSLLMSTPQMDRRQRLLMMFLPVVFVFIIVGFPAGVLVYWITTNLWTMGQQYFIRRRLGPMTPLTASTEADGGAVGKGAPGGKGGPAGDGGERRRPEPEPAPNGGGAGIAGMLRGLTKPQAEREKEKVPAGTSSRTRRASAPPPPPRKKKKRSGRRR